MRKGPANCSAGPHRAMAGILEYELPAKFEGSRVERSGDYTEVAVRGPVLHAVELRVVEGVETLSAEFEAGAVAEVERLVERGGEVGAALVRRRYRVPHYQSRDWVHPAMTE